jgi:iron(III) transport system permease protein
MTVAIPGEAVGRRARTPQSDRWWLVASSVVLALVILPLVGLIYFAARGSGDVWPNLVANVLPYAIRTTVLLLLGVSVLVAVIGVGTAWLVTMYRFPGRRIFEWALLLPLAVPTYIIAYAYLDVMHPIGPVQSTLRDLLAAASSCSASCSTLTSTCLCARSFSCSPSPCWRWRAP